MVRSARRVAYAASAVLLAAAECVSASAGSLHLFPRPAQAPSHPAGVSAADVMTGMAHCLHMSKAFDLPYNSEPGFGVLNHERGANLAAAGIADRPQLWVLTTGFEDDERSGDFIFDGDATSYNQVESFPVDAAQHGSVDFVCGSDSPAMAHVESGKRRVHHFDGHTVGNFAKLHPRDAELFSSPTSADNQFMAEVVGMYDCVEHAVESSAKKVVLSLSALEDLLEEHGADSKQYKAAKRVLKGAVADIHGKFAAKHVEAISGLVTVPPHLASVKRWMSKHLHKRDIPSAEWNSNGLSSDPRIAALQICAPTEAACNAVNLDCSGHGTCVKTAVIVANASGVATSTPDKVAEAKFCYVCDCNKNFVNGTGNRWTGTMCEYADISEQFNLLFWSTVILLTIVILTLHMVFSNDPSAKQD